MIYPLPLPKVAAGASAARREQLNQNALPYLCAAFFVLLAWLGCERVFPTPVFPVDDAYIVIHNAQVLLGGSDPNYPGSPPLSGTTSAVHLALVSLFLLGLKPLAALSAVIWTSALLYALGLVRLARVNGLGRPASVLVALLGLVAGEAPHQLLNGLETGLMLAAVTWSLTLLSGPPKLSGPPSLLLPALCGVLPYIRPDLLPLSLLLLGVQAGRRWPQRRDLRDFLRRTGLDLAAACACALPWALWYLSETGAVFPSTMNAKRFFFAEAALPLGLKLAIAAQHVSAFAASLGILCLFGVVLAATWLGRAGIVFAGVLLWAYCAQFPDALGHYEGRYLYPLLPLLLLGAIHALRQPKPLLRWAAAGVFALSLGQSLAGAPGCWALHCSQCAATVYELDGVAAWCSRNLPAGSVLLVHDAGDIAYKTQFHLIDLVGLKTPSSVAYHRELTYPTHGLKRYEAVSRIALRGHPDFLVVLDGWDRCFHITDGLLKAGWRLRLINADYIYKVYALRPPDPVMQKSPRR